MVAFDYETRLDRIFDTVLPSICNHEDQKFQLRMLKRHECLAKNLNAKCGDRIADITQIFADARERINRQHKEVERISGEYLQKPPE